MHYKHIMARLYLCGYKFVRLPLDSHKLNSRRGTLINIFVPNDYPMAWKQVRWGYITRAIIMVTHISQGPSKRQYSRFPTYLTT